MRWAAATRKNGTPKEVRAGEEIVVRNRQRAIAKIISFAVDDDEHNAKTSVSSMATS